MTDSPGVSTSTEDYLEAILRLIAEKGVARVRDIAAALSVHKSTVSSALKSLSEKGLVNYSPYEITTLTAQGREIAQRVTGRHDVIRRFLAEILGIGSDAAEVNACRMEHVLDAEVFDRLSLLVDFAKESQRADGRWMREFQHYVRRRRKLPSDGQEADRSADGPDDKPHPHTSGKGHERTMSTLDQLRPRQKANVVRVGSAGAIRRRMADMGMVRGTPVEVVKVAPLGDPIEVKVKGYSLSLRKDEAAAITVELP